MAIHISEMCLVTCDKCPAYIIIPRWQDASKLGWSAPIDGAFQWCPGCTKAHVDGLVQQAKVQKVVEKCPLANAK